MHLARPPARSDLIDIARLTHDATARSRGYFIIANNYARPRKETGWTFRSFISRLKATSDRLGSGRSKVPTGSEKTVRDH